MAVQHVYSQTVGDGTATSVVRPSDWNSFHNNYLTLSGNTAGQSTVSGTNVVFQGGNNVTLSANTAAGAATIVVSAANAVAQSTQTQPAGNIAGVGLTSTTTAGTALVGTLNTAGISLGVPAWITTFQNDLTSGRAGTGFTSTTTAGTAVVGTLNTNGLSVGVPAYITTFQNDLTSGRAGTGFSSTTTAGTAIVGTLNTNGLSVGVPAFITTFANDLTSGRAGTGFTSTTTGGTAVVGTLNTNGLSIGVPTIITNALTTAAQVSHSHNLATTTTNGSQIVIATTNSNGATMAVPPFITTFAGQTTQTQPAGNIVGAGFTSTSTAGTAVVATLNSNGLSMGVPAYLTAAGGGGGTQSVYAVSNTTQSSSGTYTNGLSFAGAGIASVGVSNGSVVVSVPAGGGAGDGVNIISMGSSGNTTGTAWSSSSASIGIYGGNNITVSQNNSNQIVISAPSGGGVGVSNLGNTLGSTGAVSDQMVFAGAGAITLSQSTNGQSATITISAGAGGAAPKAYWAAPRWGGVTALITNVTAIDRRAFFVPFENIGDLTVHEVMWPMSRSTNSSNAFTVQAGIFSYVNSSQLSLISSQQDVYSHTATASITGIRLFEVIFTNTFSIPPGQYALGMWFSANGGNTASMNYSLMGGTTSNMYSNIIHPGTDQYMTHTTHGAIPMFGRHSVTSASMPTSIGQSQIHGAFTGASMPIPMAFTIGTHN
jgi:hypothetical protein